VASERNQKQVHEICKIMGRRSDVKDVLVTRIAKGKELLGTIVQNDAQLEELGRQRMLWDDYNEKFLENTFTTDEAKKDYDESIPNARFVFDEDLPEPLDERITRIMTWTSDAVGRLASLLNQLEIIPEDSPSSQIPERGTVQPKRANSVFLVHGHNETMLAQVEAFLRKLKLQPVILKDEPNKGQTVIEKLESNSDVGYAIVFLTGDDEGREKGKTRWNKRARQNAVLELGFFLGRLGRKNVCAIYEDGVERPSDFEGVVYIDSAKWELQLIKELHDAGLEFDPKDVLS